MRTPHPDQSSCRASASTIGSTRVLGDDAAPEQVADVRAERVHPALVAIERERVVPAAVGDPEGGVEASGELVGLRLEPRRERLVVPRVAGDLGQPALRVEDVALHLGRRDRRLGEPAVAEALGVARVLPRLVLEAGGAPLVLDEAVAVAVAVRRRSRRGRPAQARGAAARAPRRPSSARPPTGARGTAVSRRPSRSSARTTSPRPGRSAARGGSSPARRRSWGRRRRAWSAASVSSALIASSGPRSMVWRLVMIVSRPNTVMNQGMPAAGRCPGPSPARSRSAARSATDWSNEWRSSSDVVERRGSRSDQASNDSRTRARSVPNLRSTCSGCSTSPSSETATSMRTSQERVRARARPGSERPRARPLAGA